MQQSNILILAIVGLVAAVLVGFLIWKNHKDKQAFDPDSQDAVDNLRMDKEKDAERD